MSTAAFCLLQIELKRGGVQGSSVVEHDARSQDDRVDGEVRIGGDRLGQVRLDLAGGGDDGQGVENGATVEESTLVPTGRGGVESPLFGVDAEREGAPALGLGR